jgi:hypothetical protein
MQFTLAASWSFSPYILISALISETVNLSSSLGMRDRIAHQYRVAETESTQPKHHFGITYV